MYFTIYGEDRQVGAIGVAEAWSFEIESESPHHAIDAARLARYSANREHVHPRLISIDGATPRTITIEDLAPKP